MLQCAVSCHLPSRDGAVCHLSRGVQCHRRGIRCYARRGRMPRPAASDAIGRGAVCFSPCGLAPRAAWRGGAKNT